MTVTRIQTLGRSRYRIYADERILCVLYKGELSAYNITEGAEITDELYDTIRCEILLPRAKKRAMNLLLKHRFTEYKLREKLRSGDYPDDIVDAAIEYVVGYGYVDDRSYARDYIVSHSMDKSIRRIYSDLNSKGIASDIIREVMNEIDGTIDDVDEEAQIRRLLSKRHFDIETADASRIRKECAYLAGRGFGMDVVRRVMNCREGISDENQI